MTGNPQAAVQGLAEARVVVVGRSRWARAAARELSAAGVGAMETPSGPGEAEDAIAAKQPAALVIAARAGEGTERIARAAHAAKVTSLWAGRSGSILAMGPLVVPGQTACAACALDESLNPAPPRQIANHPTSMDEARDGLLGHLVALEAIKVITRYAPSRLGGRMVVQDLAAWTSSTCTLVRLPWCRICGDGGAAV
ncbi:MAG: hypothetical protein QM820_34710 [Minicystis sp.]